MGKFNRTEEAPNYTPEPNHLQKPGLVGNYLMLCGIGGTKKSDWKGKVETGVTTS